MSKISDAPFLGLLIAFFVFITLAVMAVPYVNECAESTQVVFSLGTGVLGLGMVVAMIWKISEV